MSKVYEEFIIEDVELEEELPYNYELEKEKARSRRKNTKLHKRKLKRQAKELNSYPGAAFPVAKEGLMFAETEEDVLYYRPVCKSSHAKRYKMHKKFANKKVRKNLSFSGSQRGNYKKLYEYAWCVD